MTKRSEFADVITSAFHEGEELKIYLLVIDIDMKKASKKMANLILDLVVGWLLLEYDPNGHIG